MITREDFGVKKNILIAPELAFTIPVQVTRTGIIPEDGQYLLKAGTPLYATTDLWTNRQTELTVDAGVDNTLVGVALHDKVLKQVINNTTLLVDGYVDLLKLEDDVLAAVDIAKAKLPRILFMTGGSK